MGCFISSMKCHSESNTEKLNVNDPRLVEKEKWPIILLDTSTSMTLECQANNPKPRNQLVYETVWQIAQMLIPYDTIDNNPKKFKELTPQQASRLKGIPLITFNSKEGGVDRELLHLPNFVEEWKKIDWDGRTKIMDGWNKMCEIYDSKFSDWDPYDKPLLLALIITDGELEDGQEFEKQLRHVKGTMFVEVAVIGYGKDHDKALQHYEKIAKKYSHIRVTDFTDGTDPADIVKQLLSLIDPRAVQRINLSQASATSLNVRGSPSNDYPFNPDGDNPNLDYHNPTSNLEYNYPNVKNSDNNTLYPVICNERNDEPSAPPFNSVYI